MPEPEGVTGSFRICADCGTQQPGSARFCAACGASLGDSRSPAPQRPVAPATPADQAKKVVHGCLIAVLACFGLVFLLVFIGVLRAPPHQESSSPSTPAPPAASLSSPDNLTRMTVAFEGNYSREQIKARMDQAMTLYGLPITEENYGRASSVLIDMRQQNGVQEMKILNYMVRSHVPGVNVTFPEGAALAAVFLRAGDR